MCNNVLSVKAQPFICVRYKAALRARVALQMSVSVGASEVRGAGVWPVSVGE